MTNSYMVDYDYTATANGETTSGDMVMYMKNPKFRTDITTTVDGTAMTSRIIYADSKIYSCTDAAGSWSCFESEASATATSANTSEVEDNPDDYAITADGTMVVAGQTASCFRIVANDNSFTSRYCYTASGVPVYIKSEADGYVSELTATSYSETVAESDFDLPAEPGSYPGMPSGYDYSGYT